MGRTFSGMRGKVTVETAERFDGRRPGCKEQALQDSKVEAFVFEGKGQVAFERRVRGVA